jgi:uncharacterized membrane protein
MRLAMQPCTEHRLAMINRLIWFLNFGGALGAGLIAGVFFAFSSFVLPALRRLPQLQGLSAMQSINVVVLNRWFLGVFLGTALGCALLALDAAVRVSLPGAKLRLAGALFYLLGCLLVTGACNVPLNDRLASLLPQAETAARGWHEYVTAWSLWNHVRGAASFAAAALLTLALLGCSRYGSCAPPAATPVARLPERLSQTGLFSPGRPEQLADGLLELEPQFPLWSDGASKRRWLSLPAGAQIDGSDPDNWSFPPGTQLWKQFMIDGQRVETRLLRKTGPGVDDWAAAAYVWQADGLDAIATPEGMNDARGTSHDVPPVGQCRACHGGRKSFVLGVSAVQLAYDAVPPLVDLRQLAARGLVSRAPSAPLLIAGDATQRAALGYLHGNCGHCHNQDRPRSAGSRCYDPENPLDFWLKTAELGAADPRATATYRSGRGLAFEPGAPDDSRMLELMSTRGLLPQMPPLGSERVDARGVSLVRSWIASLR